MDLGCCLYCRSNHYCCYCYGVVKQHGWESQFDSNGQRKRRPRRNHKGFDYPIRRGAPITLKGDLKLSEYDSGYNAGYGNSIIITDGNGRQYLLGHLSSGPEGIIPIKSGTDAMSIQPFSRQGVNQPPRKSRRKVIVMVEENDMTPQIIQGSGGSSQIVVINPLNSFIKNQLLLDLAYT